MMGSPQEHVAMVFRALAVLVALPPLVPISPWSRRARLSTKARMPRRVHAHVCAKLGDLDFEHIILGAMRDTVDTPQTLPGPVNF
ncbi:hypothetical protein JB92DRAFT_3072728 [Gautieria morchelliformis]|nr:hypothetical protein JB92DRAFT_3072728 [Gautieria morchelliformis]